jgi:hypothetical protein
MNGQFAQMVVARADFNPGVGNTNQRLGEIFILQAGGAQHGARGGAMRTIGKNATAGFQRVARHFRIPPQKLD